MKRPELLGQLPTDHAATLVYGEPHQTSGEATATAVAGPAGRYWPSR